MHEHSELFKTTKNLQYIMKFIIRSRILFAKLNDDRDQDMFEASLEGKQMSQSIRLKPFSHFSIVPQQIYCSHLSDWQWDQIIYFCLKVHCWNTYI